ncbi:MAG TPA: DNA mismatch repair endonuclease MutL [Phycisphaerae bacterium]|nr:DNA mismatch repair endonuclease MutL [Phycisphaerae bacterium]HNU46008.1 DNA mismatch repair endonuclease MutL [Phycisphaerae bacterium]
MTTAPACRIQVLPDLLVRKIAAGEVIERPASVVKELVENAIDAGARRVAVTIEDGGKQLIRVVDDGGGMTAEELRLAVLPHATSKILIEPDLYHIETMGFRGEALASISAVARLRMVSRVPDAVEGHEIRVAADQVELSRAAGCPPGTTIEVRDLFFNVPARRKFLRTSTTESGHVHDQFARVALAHPAVAFELASGARPVHQLPGGVTRLERLAQFFGAELAQALLHIERHEQGLSLDAYAAPPAQSRATAQWQYVFVNGRYIRDRFVQHAIKEAYRGLMEPSRQAVIFLFLEVDPGLVDVNVHPTKIEVRWADSNLVHSQVLSALREAFQRADLTPALRTPWAPGSEAAADEDRVRHELAAALKAAVPIVPPGFGPTGRPAGEAPAGHPAWTRCAPSQGQSGHAPQGIGGLPGGSPAGPLGDAAWRALYAGPSSPAAGGLDGAPPPEGGLPAGFGQARTGLEGAAARAEGPGATGGNAAPRAIQMHNLYLVVETDDGIMIIDQHALHERVLYEELRRRLTQGTLEAQRLLLPETIKVTPAQLGIIETHAALLQRLGIELAPFGPDAVAVHTFPMLLKDVNVPAFLRDLLDQLGQQATQHVETEVVIHKLLDMMACKAAVKAGDALTDEEIATLVRHRHLVDRASSCPHGRPTMLRLTRGELEKQFKRK